MASTKRRVLLKGILGLAMVFAAVCGLLLMLAWASLGTSPDETSRKSFTQSKQWNGEMFLNPQPMWGDTENTYRQLFRNNPDSTPRTPVNFVSTDPAGLQRPSSLRVTWFGHSSVLLDVDQTTVLMDPVWSDRVSPFSFMGPERWFGPTLAWKDLPRVDAVIISHDHYDHLDRGTIERMRGWKSTFIVPLGVGAHLRSWGIPADRIRELDWWQSVQVKTLAITATPSRHHSGRLNPQSDRTLWAGYAMVGPTRRVFYSGDTGMHDAFKDIGTRFGPFDLALIETGQYSQAWPDWHLGPEQAVLASKLVNARQMMPIHWALFKLSDHTWTEPGVRALTASECQGQSIVIPAPGMTLDFDRSAYSLAKWWPDLPTRTAQAYPVIATHRGDPGDRYAVAACL